MVVTFRTTTQPYSRRLATDHYHWKSKGCRGSRWV